MNQNTGRIKKAALTEDEIDELVIAEAADNSAWGQPIRVTPPLPPHKREIRAKSRG